jgi:predicted phage tail protein
VPLQNADGSMNFEDVAFAHNLGTQGQLALHGFDLVSNEVTVGLRVNSGTPLVRTVLAGPDTVRVTVGIPQLSLQDLENGDMVGNKVEIRHRAAKQWRRLCGGVPHHHRRKKP